MAEIVVIKVNTEAELQTFSQYLWQQKMSHRILDQGDSVWLLVGSEEDASQVATAYKLFFRRCSATRPKAEEESRRNRIACC